MAKNTQLTNLAVNTEANALGALMDGGFIDVYDGTQPLSGDTSLAGQTLGVTLTFGTPAFAAAAAGTLIAATESADSATLIGNVAGTIDAEIETGQGGQTARAICRIQAEESFGMAPPLRQRPTVIVAAIVTGQGAQESRGALGMTMAANAVTGSAPRMRVRLRDAYAVIRQRGQRVDAIGVLGIDVAILSRQEFSAFRVFIASDQQQTAQARVRMHVVARVKSGNAAQHCALELGVNERDGESLLGARVNVVELYPKYRGGKLPDIFKVA